MALDVSAVVRFRVVGLPAPQGSKNSFRTKTGKTVVVESSKKTLAPWRDDVRRAARANAPPAPLEGPIDLRLTFVMPVPKSAPKRRRLWHTKKPDLTKLVRAVEDACRGVIYRDDSQVVAQQTRKSYGYGGQPGVVVVIYQLDGEPVLWQGMEP